MYIFQVVSFLHITQSKPRMHSLLSHKRHTSHPSYHPWFNHSNKNGWHKSHLPLQATCIAVFTHGPQGPGPRAANFQGRHIKKNRDWNMVCGKKRLSTREKFKGDLYWKQCWYHNATEFSRYDATVLGNLLTILCCIFCRLVFSSFSDFCF